jgi:hypothetical protein
MFDLRSLRLDFANGNQADVVLQFESETWNLAVGLDGKRRFASVGPGGLSVASVGRWISGDEFILDMDTVANVNHFLFNLQFHGNEVRIRMNEVTGEMKDVVVAGTVGSHDTRSPFRG